MKKFDRSGQITHVSTVPPRYEDVSAYNADLLEVLNSAGATMETVKEFVENRKAEQDKEKQKQDELKAKEMAEFEEYKKSKKKQEGSTDS